MPLYEAHVRLNHVNNQAIKHFVNAHVSDDIDHLTAGQNGGGRWCKACRGGRATRGFHYTNSMNAYTGDHPTGDLLILGCLSSM